MVTFERQLRTLIAAVALAGALLLPALAAEARNASPGDATVPDLRVDEDPEGDPYIAGELLVTYEPDLSRATKDAVDRGFEAKAVEKFPEVDARHLSFPEVKGERSEEDRERSLEQKKQALERNPKVEAVDYNYLRESLAVPNDKFFGLQWGLRKIKAPQAWDTALGGGASIAVVDTGIDASHPDLGSKISSQVDLVNNDNVANDDDGHGTHVAGIAAAITNNGEGVAGTSPNSTLRIIKVLGPRGGSDATIAAAIDRSLRPPAADVINLSLGGCAPSSFLDNAVNRAWNRGVVVVAAAGNEAERGNCTVYPAAFPNAIAVGAVNFANARSNFSNIGAYVDVVAPGGSAVAGSPVEKDILSTVPGGYDFLQGTSMSAPFVSGLAGLLSSQGLSTTGIRQRIASNAVDLGPAGRDPFFGAGLLDAQAAVTNARRIRNTAPSVASPRPAPGSRTRDLTPLIGASVRDRQTRLTRFDVSLYVDGRRVTNFRFRNGQLTYTQRLSAGAHTVRILAVDPHGLDTSKNWSFRVAR